MGGYLWGVTCGRAVLQFNLACDEGRAPSLSALVTLAKVVTISQSNPYPISCPLYEEGWQTRK